MRLRAERDPDVLFAALPRGTHNLAREVIVASQRGRLLDAVGVCVAERGYAATTIANIVKRARVSRKTFYENFADKEEAFLAAFDIGVEVMITEIVAAATRAESWRERVEIGLQTYLDLLSREPAFARTFLVEITAAGPRAREHRSEALDRFAELFRGAGEDRSSATARRLLVSGINELVAQRVLDGKLAELPALEPTLRDCALRLLGVPALAT